MRKTSGLVRIWIDVKKGDFLPNSKITVGANGDSYYEYLLKQWLLTGKTKNL